ncbi:MAG: hypothetical protein K9J17_11580 [Flavobacteriales bacterium]|nr:hypothetical protein [Flavobacteriales bacterium]
MNVFGQFPTRQHDGPSGIGIALTVVLVVIFTVVSVVVRAQSTPLADTLYFDKKWELCNKKKHSYYRVCTFKDLLYVIKDYYADGQIQFEGTWLLKDTSQTRIRFNGHPTDDRAIGTAKYYYKNGNPAKRIDFLPIGEPCNVATNYLTEHTEYYKNGGIGATWQERRRKEHGTIYMYDEEKGALVKTMEMANGLAHRSRRSSTQMALYTV